MKKRDPYAAAKKMVDMERVVFNVRKDDIEEFDRLAAESGFQSRAEALRFVVQKQMTRWAALPGETEP